jgi:hypothetical protein
MIVGALGPWATVFFITVHGTDDGKDGWIVVGAAAAAGLAVLTRFVTRRRWLAIVPLLAGLLAAATAGYDVSDISSTASRHGLPGNVVSTDWGVYLALVASISLALASVGLWIENSRRARNASAEPV